MKTLVAHGLAVGNALPIRIHFPDGKQDRPDRRLGRPAQADHVHFGQHAPNLVRQAQRNPVAAHHHQPQRIAEKFRLPGLIHEQLQQRGHRIPEGDSFGKNQFSPVIRVVGEIRGGHHNGSARRQQSEHVVHRKIEAEPGNGEDAVLRADSESLVDVEDGVQRAAVVDHHALGNTRGTRSVNDVGEIFRFLPPPVRWRNFIGGLQLIDLEHFDGCGHAQAVSHAGLGQCHFHLGVFQQKALAFRRQFRIDGEISRARKMNSQDGDDLLPALLHHDGDEIVRLYRQRSNSCSIRQAER